MKKLFNSFSALLQYCRATCFETKSKGHSWKLTTRAIESGVFRGVLKPKRNLMKAIWNGQVVAESEDTVVVEGNHYFPMDSLKKELFTETSTNTVCPWKGTANYYSLVVDGKENKDAAWYYPTPSELAKNIKDRVAFWRGVEVTH